MVAVKRLRCSDLQPLPMQTAGNCRDRYHGEHAKGTRLRHRHKENTNVVQEHGPAAVVEENAQVARARCAPAKRELLKDVRCPIRTPLI